MGRGCFIITVCVVKDKLASWMVFRSVTLVLWAEEEPQVASKSFQTFCPQVTELFSPDS